MLAEQHAFVMHTQRDLLIYRDSYCYQHHFYCRFYATEWPLLTSHIPYMNYFQNASLNTRPHNQPVLTIILDEEMLQRIRSPVA